jgi:UrcA family protein
MRKIIIAALAASVFAGVGAAAAAPTVDAPATRRLSVSKVDFSNPEAVRTLHQRLHRAAREACNSGYIIATQLIDADRTCTEQALAQAVAKVDRPMLTAMQQQRQTTMTARGY